MAAELRIPSVGESITEVQIGQWLKAEGERVERDENLVVLETDKVSVELPAPAAGVLSRVLLRTGERARVGDLIGYLEPGEGNAPVGKPQVATPLAPAPPAPGVAVAPAPAAAALPVESASRVGPSARQALVEHGLQAHEVVGTGPGGRVSREDVLHAAARRDAGGAGGADAAAAPAGEGLAPVSPPAAPVPSSSPPSAPPSAPSSAPPAQRPAPGAREEESVPMSPLRRRLAERLVSAQHAAALLTTFNEIDMSAVVSLRTEHQEVFLQRYGVKLGFMSFFVKAAIDALKAIPQLNAEIRGDNLVYRNYFDIGIAVGGGKGLVVPVLRDADRLSFAETEQAIGDFARRAEAGKLTLAELQGGTFTLSNGGVYGSLLSTPIVNPPQSGVLGLHAIQDRPVARAGQVVIRPMMYVALTYDHRIVDGREAVTFLKRIKEAVEEPARMLVEV